MTKKQTHGNTGNKNAAKSQDNKVSQGKINLAVPIALKNDCISHAQKKGQKLSAWCRKALEDKCNNESK